MEKWLPIKGYEGLYEVSSDGNVRSFGRMVRFSRRPKMTKDQKISPVFKKNTGYMQVTLYNGIDKPKILLLHRVVADAFICSVHGKIVNHLDGNKTNNTVSNLEVGTYGSNQKHAIENGLIKLRRGVDIKSSKLKDADVFDIIEMGKNGVPQKHIAEKYGVRQQAISKILNGTSWRHITAADKVIQRDDYGSGVASGRKRSDRPTLIIKPKDTALHS